MTFVLGTLRCHECGRTHVGIWDVEDTDLEQECDYCGRSAAIPVRAVPVTMWPEQAARVAIRQVRDAQVIAAKRGRES